MNPRKSKSSGVDGNGQSELIKCLTGLSEPKSGSFKISGTDSTHATTKQILKNGVSHIPEDRHRMGMVAEMSLQENLILIEHDQQPYSRHGLLNWKWISQHTRQVCRNFDIKAESINEKIGKLSGGNQ